MENGHLALRKGSGGRNSVHVYGSLPVSEGRSGGGECHFLGHE